MNATSCRHGWLGGVLLTLLSGCMDFEREVRAICSESPERCGEGDPAGQEEEDIADSGTPDADTAVLPRFTETPSPTSTVGGSGTLSFQASAMDPKDRTLHFSWLASAGSLGVAQDTATRSTVTWTAPSCLPAGVQASFMVSVGVATEVVSFRFFATVLPACETWSSTGSLFSTRSMHTATLLPSGAVLVAGGFLSSDTGLATSELYVPEAGTWSSTGSLTTGRYGHTATLLPSGQVLIAGGRINEYSQPTLATSELYVPGTGTWSSTGSLIGGRTSHTATLLPSGKVLVVGGLNGDLLKTAELYDPGTGKWSSTGSLTMARWRHTATLLPSGKVLVMGGYNWEHLATAELYDPGTGTWSSAGRLATGRSAHTATLLPTGKVLVTGGGAENGPALTAELYAPETGSWSLAGNSTTGRYEHTATLLSSGKVLVTGGAWQLLPTELYDPWLGTWSVTGPSQRGTTHTATLLLSGKVLVAGGYREGGYVVTSEVYTP